MEIKSFIHTADWHLWDKHKYSIDGSRLEQLVANANEIIDAAIESGVNVIIIAGDVFHVYNPDEKILNEFTKIISRAMDDDIMVRIVIGNHDTNGIEHAFGSLQNILNVNRYYSSGLLRIYDYAVEYEDFDNVRFVYVPWCKDMPEALKSAQRNMSKKDVYNVLVTHCDVNKTVTSTGYVINKSRVDRSDLKGWDYVALGDIHKPQEIDRVKNAFYTGSIIKINWGERFDKKQFNLVELGEKVNVLPVPLSDVNMIEMMISESEISKLIDGVDEICELGGISVENSFIKLNIKDKIGFGTDSLLLKKILLDSGAIEVYLREIDKKIEYDGVDGELELSLDIGDAIELYVNGMDLKDKKDVLEYGKNVLLEVR